MGIPYYTNTILPFIASIVIGTIQLVATIDYAILITTKYITNRENGLDKKSAVDNALGSSISAIVTSGLCFFGATFGVGFYSEIEMIGSLCTLMFRGTIISMIVVIFVLPAFLQIFDKVICKSTICNFKFTKCKYRTFSTNNKFITISRNRKCSKCYKYKYRKNKWIIK